MYIIDQLHAKPSCNHVLVARIVAQLDEVLMPMIPGGRPLGMKRKVLVVDDDELIRASFRHILEFGDFEVATAAGVRDALRLIGSEVFDVLLSDLDMREAGDCLTVVSAIRQANPAALTVIFGAFAKMKEAAAAQLLLADEVLVKPVAPMLLIHTIQEGIKRGGRMPRYPLM